MPELPEVETTMRGIAPHVCGQNIIRVIIRDHRLRWPIPKEVQDTQGRKIESVSRRGKYILMRLDQGTLIWHLGMSGSMRVLPVDTPPEKHEHVELQLGSGLALKFRDPRRFGALLYTDEDPLQHRLLSSLGPEPLSDEFNAVYLYTACKNKSAAIKLVIMDSQIVTGVGNIYACEALFSAGIKPTAKAGRISRKRLATLIEAIRDTLRAAIQQGGTTLQDFSQVDGNPGYFTQSLKVYGVKEPCIACGTNIKQVTQGQRSSYFCPKCQT